MCAPHQPQPKPVDQRETDQPRDRIPYAHATGMCPPHKAQLRGEHNQPTNQPTNQQPKGTMHTTTNVHHVASLKIVHAGVLNEHDNTHTTDLIITDRDGNQVEVTMFHKGHLDITHGSR